MKSIFSSNRVIDPYYILGVEKRTEYDEIKKVYYKLVSQYHPDKNPSPVKWKLTI
jgi:DnaJ-class molecular chaperone